jgi:hypothetical protein
LTNIVDFHVFSNHKFRSEYFSTATSICSKYLPNAFCGNTLLRSPNHIPPSCLSEFRPGRDENEGIPPAPHDLRREGGCHKIDAPTPNPTASDKGGCRKIRREIRGTPPRAHDLRQQGVPDHAPRRPKTCSGTGVGYSDAHASTNGQTQLHISG